MEPEMNILLNELNIMLTELENKAVDIGTQMRCRHPETDVKIDTIKYIIKVAERIKNEIL